MSKVTDSSILDKQHDLPAFRAAIRTWLEKNCPSVEEVEDMEAAAGIDYAKFEKYQRAWMAKLSTVGLSIPHWPVEYGGAGLSLKHLIIIADEMAKAGAPQLNMYVISFNHIPATLLAWGTEEQKRKYLPGVGNGTPWCQGFSEPGAGSDLASLRCKAERVGNEYIVNGQKIWSSQSKHAEYCILLTRTDPNVRKHAGITYLIMNMKAPGVEVRPIRQATGRAEFSELFLTNVRIPVEDRIGEENKGWAVALTTLASECGLYAFEDAERLRYKIEKFYQRALARDDAWLRDAEHRREFLRIVSRLQAVRGLIRELLEHNQRTPDAPTMLPSVIKIGETTAEQRFFSWQARIKGTGGQYMEPLEEERGHTPEEAMLEYIASYGRTIAGGTNEVQHNIISERGLGMPRG